MQIAGQYTHFRMNFNISRGFIPELRPSQVQHQPSRGNGVPGTVQCCIQEPMARGQGQGVEAQEQGQGLVVRGQGQGLEVRGQEQVLVN